MELRCLPGPVGDAGAADTREVTPWSQGTHRLVWAAAWKSSSRLQRAGAVSRQSRVRVQGCTALALLEPQFPHLSNGCIGVLETGGPVCLLHSLTLHERSVILGMKTHLASNKILYLRCSQVRWRERKSLGFCISSHKQLLILR